MFAYFHNHKLCYEKGQAAPFFIMIVVILVIMAMVGVNLSKVALIKTQSSNAADAGGLASGSMMANIFNSAAQANSNMEAAYWEFFASVSISFAIATAALTAAYIKTVAVFGPSGVAKGLSHVAPDGALVADLGSEVFLVAALNWLMVYCTTMWGILIAVTAFHVAQYFYYKSIRKSVSENRLNAIQNGHQFVFINSGISSKLPDAVPVAGDPEDVQRNSRTKFGTFLDDGIGNLTEYSYSWTDRQERSHYVVSKISIADVENYDLQVCVLPLAAEIAALGTALVLGYGAKSAIMTAASSLLVKTAGVYPVAGICQKCCNNPWTAAVCCPCWWINSTLGFLDNILGDIADASAMGNMTACFFLIPTAWAGLAPGYTVDDGAVDSGLTFIICWIDDIKHDRLTKAETWQYHQGKDLGLWKTGYPAKADQPQREIYSYSLVDFTGKGKIYPPVMRHDASIAETDYKPTYSPCASAAMQIASLEAQANELKASAVEMRQSAVSMKQQAVALRTGQGGTSPDVLESAAQMDKDAAALEAQAAGRDTDAQSKLDQRDAVQAANSACP